MCHHLSETLFSLSLVAEKHHPMGGFLSRSRPSVCVCVCVCVCVWVCVCVCSVVMIKTKLM